MLLISERTFQSSYQWRYVANLATKTEGVFATNYFKLQVGERQTLGLENSCGKIARLAKEKGYQLADFANFRNKLR